MHRSVRLAAPAAAAVAALLLSGCAGDGGNDAAAAETGSDGDEATAQPRDEGAEEADEPAGDDAPGGSGEAPPAEYEAVWMTAEPPTQTLSIVDGEALLQGDEDATLCVGPARMAGGGVALALVCTDPETGVPDEERAGLASVNGDTLSVRWESRGTVEYAKALDLSGTTPPPGLDFGDMDLGDLDLGDLGAEFEIDSEG
ncbi:hypothetical protein FNQ90_00490 [Streptomyces alkaliphilus]|uniref:Lipoprotein n=1 Tax=Streptomyces alkaliphilus TaxID=1472722 RepID=A0A7W3XZT6_9ACTN|nr:hypothetical protein [Streptomyces alkaliphilus]MBB0242622.1 hypothetical protein [Streptomyces alkaliphilus]